VTVSTCIVESWPNSWALSWVKTTPEVARRVRESLELDDTDFADLQLWVSRSMDNGKFGWPDVFLSLRSAREFKNRFLGAIAGSRIVGLSLAKDVAAEFLREERPQEGHGAPGVWTMLKREVALNQQASLLGFDVLGAEYGGSFHTFSCNGLEEDLNKKLGITFNEYGLIGDYSSALAASDFTNRDDVGAEPVAWYPFRVDEYQPEEPG